MKNVKTLTATILLSMGLMIGGCGSQQDMKVVKGDVVEHLEVNE